MVRIRLAQVASGRTPADLASAAGISLRTYQRILDGTRGVRRGELVAIAELTNQELSFFGASFDGAPPERRSLPLLPGVVNDEATG